ncbi:MAG: RloB family protein [Bacteroidota bacterium]
MGRSRRPSRGKEIKPTFFVFCEGKTEELYVKYLKSKYRIPIEIDTQVAKNGITSKYIKGYKNGKFTHKKDKTFLLYDLDAPKMLERLQQIPGTILLASNPCIELWYLLHLKEQKAEIDCNACNKEIKKQNGQYSKTKIGENLKSILDTKYLKAINRAKKLETFKNPSSTVYLLIEALEEVKKERA